MNDTQTSLESSGSPPIPQPQAPEAACSVRLSERDEAAVLAAAEEPPAPNEAAIQAARRFIRRNE